MGNVISFERRVRGNHDGNWICGEKRYVEELKRAVDLYGSTRNEDKFWDIYNLMESGLSNDYNLQISAKCGARDEDIELEMICDSDGECYYAIYTDALQAKRSSRHKYYNVNFKLPMNYLLGSVRQEKEIRGICLNPYSGTPVVFTTEEINEIYQAACV